MKGWGQQRGVAAASAKVQGKKLMNGACKKFFFHSKFISLEIAMVNKYETNPPIQLLVCLR